MVCCELSDENCQFEPCGHRIACEDCAARMKKCLACGTAIGRFLLRKQSLFKLLGDNLLRKSFCMRPAVEKRRSEATELIGPWTAAKCRTAALPGVQAARVGRDSGVQDLHGTPVLSGIPMWTPDLFHMCRHSYYVPHVP
ncbi:hypothetical protein EVAR_42634_1 [Eumeta japonica]|uniref:Uncharacterized protein n=1 Tax=Eumeta variegata TaxID=151549 RepID=A0A4C1WVK2_EUMVA|nr:hypothetical protein EVAR_42634_1 [Eumeta japonica]